MKKQITELKRIKRQNDALLKGVDNVFEAKELFQLNQVINVLLEDYGARITTGVPELDAIFAGGIEPGKMATVCPMQIDAHGKLRVTGAHLPDDELLSALAVRVSELTRYEDEHPVYVLAVDGVSITFMLRDDSLVGVQGEIIDSPPICDFRNAVNECRADDIHIEAQAACNFVGNEEECSMYREDKG